MTVKTGINPMSESSEMPIETRALFEHLTVGDKFRHKHTGEIFTATTINFVANWVELTGEDGRSFPRKLEVLGQLFIEV